MAELEIDLFQELPIRLTVENRSMKAPGEFSPRVVRALDGSRTHSMAASEQAVILHLK